MALETFFQRLVPSKSKRRSTRAAMLFTIICLSLIPFLDGPENQATKPNIIFILTDDLDASSVKFMPRLRTLLINQGVTLTNAFVTYSQCCPSRASILTGQYAHNHGILANSPPLGGFEKFRQTGKENSTVATWLQDAGYRTVLLGKYLNGYPAGDNTYVPPGWDEWYGIFSERRSSQHYFNYLMNENGTVVTYGDGPEEYETDVLAGKVVDFIDRAEANDGQPFFIYLAPDAPHPPATPAPRHENEFDGLRAPQQPSFNEEDVSDKPQWLQNISRLSAEEILQIDELYRKRLRSLLAVDEMIQEIMGALTTYGELESTYIFFSSDNGVLQGEHRLPGAKNIAYEESIRVPLIVRGPGVPAGRAVEHMALNIDFAPTFADLTAASRPDFIDGRSLVPLLGSSPPSLETWRKDFLVERGPSGGGGVPPFDALRTVHHLYVEYATGERELYDMRRDPYQLESLHQVAEPSLVQSLVERLEFLKNCRAATCRE